MAHPHHLHREHQVSHRRVHHILKEEPDGAKHHAHSHAFSKVTSKSAAEHHDGFVAGKRGAKRYARGGKVKGKGHQTNIAIVVPHHGGAAPPPGGPAGMPPPPMGGPPGGAPGAPPMPPPGAGGPPGMPPGMPMRKSGGRVIDGESTKANIKKWSKRASSNSYFRGGAASGVGREEKAEHQRRK
jgi:hypothetical protein